jgi:HSP20 family protein
MDQHRIWEDMRRQVSDMANSLDAAVRSVQPFRALRGYPPVAIYRDEDAVVIVAEVPGAAREDLVVNLRDRTLLIEGREDRGPYEQYSSVRDERGPSEFSREIRLPEEVDAEEEPRANLRRGLLTVRLKRTTVERGRTIPVQEPGAGR